MEEVNDKRSNSLSWNWDMKYWYDIVLEYRFHFLSQLTIYSQLKICCCQNKDYFSRKVKSLKLGSKWSSISVRPEAIIFPDLGFNANMNDEFGRFLANS